MWEPDLPGQPSSRVNILQPGCGVDSHCIAVDPWFIVNQNPDTAKIIHQARLINDYKPHYVVEQVEQAVAGLSNPKIACLGLAFKPDIDDLRESPALDITKTPANNPAYQILAVEPNIKTLPAALENRNNVKLSSLSVKAIREADIVIILVKHKVFTSICASDFKENRLFDYVNAIA